MKTLLAAWLGLSFPVVCSHHCQVIPETSSWSLLPLVSILYAIRASTSTSFSCFLELQAIGHFQYKMLHFKIKLSANWESIPCILLRKSGSKRWRKWKLQYDSNSTQAVWLTWWDRFSAVLSLAFVRLSRASESSGTEPPFQSFDPGPARGRAVCLRTLKQPKRCFKLCSYNDKVGAANPDCYPSPASVLSIWGIALFFSPA